MGHTRPKRKMGRNQPNSMSLLSTGLDSAQPKPHDRLLFTVQYRVTVPPHSNTLINFPVTVHMHSTPKLHAKTTLLFKWIKFHLNSANTKQKNAQWGRLQFNQNLKSETSLLITLKKQFRRHQKQQSPETETYNRSHAFLQETEGKKKHETRTCKNKVPLIKRTLPHVFSLFLLHL